MTLPGTNFRQNPNNPSEGKEPMTKGILQKHGTDILLMCLFGILIPLGGYLLLQNNTVGAAILFFGILGVLSEIYFTWHPDNGHR